MPGKKVQCTSCLKVMRSDNLGRHIKSCKKISSRGTPLRNDVGIKQPTFEGDLSFRKRGNGLIMDYTSGNGVGDRRKSMTQLDVNSTDREVSTTDDDESDQTPAEIPMEEEVSTTDDESDHTPADDSEENDARYSDTDRDWLWEKLIELSHINKPNFLKLLKGVILLQIESESDMLFNAIMFDVINAESRCKSQDDAVEFALMKNKEAIVASINGCKDDDGNSFWCVLARQNGGVNCRWFNGKICYCRSCGGKSIFERVASFIVIFIEMMEDELIQQIHADVKVMENKMELADAVCRTVDRYKGKILAKFRAVEKVIFANRGHKVCIL